MRIRYYHFLGAVCARTFQMGVMDDPGAKVWMFAAGFVFAWLVGDAIGWALFEREVKGGRTHGE